MTSDTQQIIHHWRDAVPNDRLAHLVRDVSRAFTRSLTIRLEQHGVPFGHWTFLRVLWETDELTQKELSERAGVMEPTTFIAMKSMEALGYIVRKKLPPNKKNIYIYLTNEGRALKDKLVPLAIECNDRGVEGIPAAEIKAVRAVLLAIIENLAIDEQKITAQPKRKLSIAAKKLTLSSSKTSRASVIDSSAG
ncbi:MAG: transcriptional regulator, MarR family [Polaromonas sp.]|nr:transcriptional regulator, MarR family [Polaromonas sp.]